MQRGEELKDMREYAWNYFQLHAGQRMSLFNFFIILSALLTTGLAGTFKKDYDAQICSYLGLTLSFGLCVMSFVFWKLDQRIRYLIKHSEGVLKAIEDELHIEKDRISQLFAIFYTEEKKTNELKKNKKLSRWHLTYSQCFGVIYCVFALVGLVGIILSTYHLVTESAFFSSIEWGIFAGNTKSFEGGYLLGQNMVFENTYSLRDILTLLAIVIALFSPSIRKAISRRALVRHIKPIVKKGLGQLRNDLTRIIIERNHNAKDSIAFNTTSFSEISQYYFLFSDIISPNAEQLKLENHPHTIDFFNHYRMNIETLRARKNAADTSNLTRPTVDLLMQRLEAAINEFN